MKAQLLQDLRILPNTMIFNNHKYYKRSSKNNLIAVYLSEDHRLFMINDEASAEDFWNLVNEGVIKIMD